MTMSHRRGWGLHTHSFGRVRGNKVGVGEVQGGELYPSDSRQAVRFSSRNVLLGCGVRNRRKAQLRSCTVLTRPQLQPSQSGPGTRVKKYSAMFSFERATVQGDHRHPDKARASPRPLLRSEEGKPLCTRRRRVADLKSTCSRLRKSRRGGAHFGHDRKGHNDPFVLIRMETR
jgi:hypothetical protein